MLAGLMLALCATSAYPEYPAAYARHRQDKLPLVVLVGGSGCGHCLTMKNERMPGLFRRLLPGRLRRFHYTEISLDDDDFTTARAVLSGNSIPQLVIYEITPDGRQLRRELTGLKSVEEIDNFLRPSVP